MVEEKRHAACDECRRKKLKCTGEPEGCHRCQNEGINCVYSYRRQMGRPKKRKLDENMIQPLQESPSQTASVGPSTIEPDLEDMQKGPYYTSTQSSVTPHDTEQGHILESFDISPHTDGDMSTSSGYLMGERTDLTSTSSTTLDSRLGAPGAPCACLARMYLATADLQAGSQKFPFHLKPIRAAIETVKQLANCEICTSRTTGGNQNLLFVTSLLHTISEHTESLLISIDEEARVAQASNSTKELCLGDNRVENSHLHTHTLGCPGRFTVNLDPEEWRKIAKRTVMQEVRGATDNRITLEELLDSLEARQHLFHAMCNAGPALGSVPPQIPGDFTCLRLLNEVRKGIARLPVS